MTNTTKGPSARDILGELRTDTEKRLDAMQQRLNNPLNMEAKIAELDQQLKEASQIKNKEERDIRVKVLQATFGQIREEAKQEEVDLSQAILGLSALMNELGEGFENIDKPSPEEQGWISDAEMRLNSAKDSLAVAKNKWKIFGIRDRAVAASEAEIKAATDALAQAQARAKDSARQRLMKANIEQSMQNFMNKVEKTIELMKNRVKMIDEQIQIVSVRKQEAFRVKTESAAEIEKLDAELQQKEAEYATEQENLKNMVAGSPEADAQEARISQMGTALEDLRGRRNQAFVLHQSKERFAAELEIHERSQMKLRDNHIAWITLLRSDSEERQATFRSRLEAAKGLADQDVASNLNKLGGKIDQNNVEFMAKAGHASDKHRMEMIEEHPQKMLEMHKLRSAVAEAHAKILQREHEQLRLFRERYGINPLEASHSSYSSNGESAPSNN